MQSVSVLISRIHFPVTTLGPGRRVGIWFQGCSIRCSGCISADTWGFNRGRTTISELLKTVGPWLSEADGITISGGEPFDQSDALVSLLQQVRCSDQQDVLVYTGHAVEAITDTLNKSRGLIDALISDPFEQSTAQTLALRGSDNQRLHLLTALGRERLSSFERRLNAADSKLDVMFDQTGGVWLAGIPRRGDMTRLQRLMKAQGHEILTSVATRTT